MINGKMDPMRLCWILFLLTSLLCRAENTEEALFLRRIADFWQEGEYEIAKSQMEEFIIQYPESSFTDALSSALGDLSLREKNYSNALSYYSRIQNPEFMDRVFLNRMQCLYELQWYATLAEECEIYLQKETNLYVTYFLAISLYHQCLNSLKDPETLTQLAMKARPYFEMLSQSELSKETAQSFAHLCCMLKDYSTASQIYLELAKKDPSLEEEMLFQVGLIQSEFDKSAAIATFDQIATMGQKRSKDALYNKLVLSFDLGRQEEIKKVQFNDLPPDRIGMAHLFLGRSYIISKEYEKAINELKIYLEDANGSETIRAALISLLEASYQCDDLSSLDQAIAKLMALCPEDTEIPKAYFSRAQVLKKLQNIPAAKNQLEQLLTQFPQFHEKPQALFELLHLDYQAKSWNHCNKQARLFLAEFSNHELAPFVWHYLVSSSAELANKNQEFKEQLICDLQSFLDQNFLNEEKSDWQFLLAKTYFELHQYDSAMNILQELKTPNAILFLALCYKEKNNLERFCELAQVALSQGANLIDEKTIHLALYNAYLQLSQTNQAAEHMYIAFQRKANVTDENLLWLADFYYNQSEENKEAAERAVFLLENLKCKTALHTLEGSKDEPSLTVCIVSETTNEASSLRALHYESTICKLAKIYSILGRVDEQIALLEALPSSNNEVNLLLAEGYVAKGFIQKAITLFDSIITSSATLRSHEAAAACLQGARLKLMGENPDFVKIATQLKNLIMQKTLANEPIHLEAALDYIDLQAKDPKKRIALLKKTKTEFERTDDLLSKDYHETRMKLPEKDKIYQGYMQLIEAEILAAETEPDIQNQNEAKSKEILQKIVQEKAALTLLERARVILNNFR